MGTLLKSIFCCTSSPKPSKVAIKPQTNESSHTPDAQKLQKNRLKSHVNMDKDANDMSNIPMEYVNPKDESPQEVAIKGRRQSVVVIPPGEQTSETSTEQESHQSTPAEEPRQGNSLLPAKPWPLRSRKCLVLDLDETLVHSSFKYLWNADFMIPVQIDNQVHQVYVVKRPGVDEFLAAVSELYEVVVFTASVSRYGDPLLDHLDKDHKIHHRLFRESCYNQDGNYLKDLSALGRPLNDVIIIDNSPAAYALQPFNAVPVSSWFSDMHDNELLDMIPFLQDLATKNVPDVVKILQTAW